MSPEERVFCSNVINATALSLKTAMSSVFSLITAVIIIALI